MFDPFFFVDLLDHVVHHLLEALRVVALLVGPQKSGFLHPVRRYILLKGQKELIIIGNELKNKGKMRTSSRKGLLK